MAPWMEKLHTYGPLAGLRSDYHTVAGRGWQSYIRNTFKSYIPMAPWLVLGATIIPLLGRFGEALYIVNPLKATYLWPRGWTGLKCDYHPIAGVKVWQSFI